MAESYGDAQRRLLDALVEEPSGTLGLGQDLGLGRRRRRRRLPPDLGFDPGNLLPFGSTPPAGMPRWVQWIIDRVGEPTGTDRADAPTDTQLRDLEEDSTAQELNATLDKIYNEYPLLRDFNIKVIDSRDQPTLDQRKMEFYNPTETRRSERAAPFFGTPTIELFEGMKGRELYRPLVGDMLHHARDRIPGYQDYREQFKASMTDEQIERELEVWNYWTERGEENRSFADYLDISGIDAVVHGHPDMPSAMPEDGISLEGKRKFYTSEQDEIVRKMVGLLSNEDTLLLPPVRPEGQGIVDLMKGLVSQDAPPEKRRPPQLTLDQVKDSIAASGGDGDLGPYVPEPSKTWSFQPRINEPFAEPPSDEEFQRRLALSHLNAIIHPTKAAVVKRLAGSMLGLGPLGQKAVDLLPKPSFTDREAQYLQSITDAARKDLRWMGGRHHEAAPPLASEIEAYQNAQAVQAAAEQAATMTQDQFPLVSGVDIDPGLPAQDFDPEVALAIAGITPQALGM
jgi:hypothetical protein